MSRSLNRELRSWKVVLARLRRVETTWRGIRLSEVDHRTYTEAILMCGLVLHDLSLRYDGCGNHRDHVLWCTNCAHTDVSDLASFLSDAIVLWRGISSPVTDIATYADFKRQLGKKYPFAGKLLAPIREAVEHHLRYPAAATFYPVYQFLSFMTHLTLLDLDQAQELEDGYMAIENRIRQRKLPDGFVDEMNFIMRRWLHGFSIESNDFLPSHGPGSVAELNGNVSKLRKYQALSPDAIIEYVFRKHTDLDVREFMPDSGEIPLTTRESQIVFVPKSMKTKRVISKEPATLMYFQKGVERELKKFLSRHKYLSTRIDLRDQSKQTELALEASRTRKFATVDLSAASDSVSLELVKRVFYGTTLYPFLIALRSRTTRLPSGKVTELAKFAPMGSALCFPIETLIFACIIECTVRYVERETGVLHNTYRVYGDDLIVSDPCLEDLIIYLRLCGFTINQDKTYGGTTRFRESCGCDAYDGYDVSCMKIGRRFASVRLTPYTPSVFEGLVSMANTAHRFKFQLLRRFILDNLLNDSHFLPLFSEIEGVGVFTPHATNFRAPRKWSKGFQAWRVKVAGSRTVVGQDSDPVWDRSRHCYVQGEPLVTDDTIRYFEWLRLTFNRQGDAFDPDFVVQPAIGSSKTCLTRRWVTLS